MLAVKLNVKEWALIQDRQCIISPINPETALTTNMCEYSIVVDIT
jgi:hypothetical protein